MDAKEEQDKKEWYRVYECNGVMRPNGVIQLPVAAALPLRCRWSKRVPIKMIVDLARRTVTISIPESEQANAQP